MVERDAKQRITIVNQKATAAEESSEPIAEIAKGLSRSNRF
jgi:hypothetical protein